MKLRRTTDKCIHKGLTWASRIAPSPYEPTWLVLPYALPRSLRRLRRAHGVRALRAIRHAPGSVPALHLPAHRRVLHGSVLPDRRAARAAETRRARRLRHTGHAWRALGHRHGRAPPLAADLAPGPGARMWSWSGLPVRCVPVHKDVETRVHGFRRMGKDRADPGRSDARLDAHLVRHPHRLGPPGPPSYRSLTFRAPQGAFTQAAPSCSTPSKPE